MQESTNKYDSRHDYWSVTGLLLIDLCSEKFNPTVQYSIRSVTSFDHIAISDTDSSSEVVFRPQCWQL